MTPEQFKSWRKAMGLKQKEAADLLGLKKRVIQYYERGHRDGKAVEVPRTVELACYAISAGIESFDGEAATPAAAASDAPKRTKPRRSRPAPAS
jgi:transcriptional regulator with XRE-family HTH domain